MTNNPDNSTPIEIIDNSQSTQPTQATPTSNKTNVNSFSNIEIEDGRTLSTLVHLLGLVTSFLGPLLIYAITTNPLVKMHSKNALNFQISLAIYFLISSFLTIILIGLIGLLVCGILGLVLPIIATIKASDNIVEDYQYPFTLKIIS